MIIDTLKPEDVFPELAHIVGDSIPMSSDGGRTWCTCYSAMQNQPEKTWVPWWEVYLERVRSKCECFNKEMIGFDPLTKETRPILERLIQLGGHGDHLEIGTLYGASAIYSALTKQLHDLRGRVFCIDPFDMDLLTETIIEKCVMLPTPEIVMDNALEAGVDGRLVIVQAKSDPFPLPCHRFATAYIDGDHSFEAVKRDWLNVSPLVDKAILFDDCQDWGDVYRLLHEVVEQDPEWTLEFIDKAWMCLAVRK